MTTLNWHAVLCGSGRELKTADELRKQTIEVGGAVRSLCEEVFCPSHLAPWRVADRSMRGRRMGLTKLASREEGVFAPYLFVRTQEYLAVQRVPGVLKVVAICGAPLVVPDRVMARIKAACDAAGRTKKNPAKPSFWFEGKPGNQFQVMEGPFAGFVATIESIKHLDATGCVASWVEVFGRVTSVAVPLEQVGDLLAA